MDPSDPNPPAETIDPTTSDDQGDTAKEAVAQR